MIAANRTWFGVLAFALATAIPSIASAQDGKADALFREGRAALDAKKYDEACPKLAKSQELDPGAGTLVALAMCHEGQGKTATAYREMLEASAMGKKNGRADLAVAAQKRAAQMEPSLTKVIVRVAPEAESPGLVVRFDDKTLSKDELGVATAVDPGEHRVVASARGKTTRTRTLKLSGAGTTDVLIDRLEDPAAAPPAVAPKITPMAEPPPPDSDAVFSGGAQRTIGVLTMTSSLAGFGLAAYFGSRSLSESAEADRACTKQPCNDAARDDVRERAKASGNLALFSVAAGAGALTLGAVLYFTAPKEPSKKAEAPKKTARVLPSVDPRAVSVDVVGTF